MVNEVATRIGRGIGGALRSRPGVVASVTAGVFLLDIFLPPALLSAVRVPLDYFTFNPWLPQLPAYLANGGIPLARKLEFLPNLALFWFSADSAFGGTDWGFAVTVGDLFRLLVLAFLFGLYFALVLHCRDRLPSAGWSVRYSRKGGVSGAVASVFGISTGGCTVVGCGAPVLPVVGLAFAGLSSGTLVLLAEISRIATVLVFTLVILGVLWFAWLAGGGQRSAAATPEHSGAPA